MELMEAIRDRRSIRKFLPEPVAEEDLAEIVAAGTLAPNAENDQMWRFVAVTNKELIDQIGEAVSLRVDSMIKACETMGYDGLAHHKYFLVFFQNAPAIITAFTRPSVNAVDKALEVLGMELKSAVPVDPVQQSIGAALQNMSLVAHAKGYGSTWMFGPVLAHREIAQLLGVPEPWMLSALLPIGRSNQRPRPRPRKPLSEVYTLIK